MALLNRINMALSALKQIAHSFSLCERKRPTSIGAMASLKKLGLTNESKHNEVILKKRVQELEEEVVSLRKRLDELRKAKNTTILKREREVLEVGTPFGKRGNNDKSTENNKSYEKDMDELRKKFASEMDQMKKDFEKESHCDHEELIEVLRREILDLQADNGALMVENTDLKDRVTSLVTELSVKEAKWCEMEEKMRIEIQKSWGDKYKRWMEETEGKFAELQQTNQLLRGYLKKQKPQGPDPSGKDPYPGI